MMQTWEGSAHILYRLLRFFLSSTHGTITQETLLSEVVGGILPFRYVECNRAGR